MLSQGKRKDSRSENQYDEEVPCLDTDAGCLHDKQRDACRMTLFPTEFLDQQWLLSPEVYKKF